MKNFQIRIFSNKKILYFRLIFPRDIETSSSMIVPSSVWVILCIYLSTNFWISVQSWCIRRMDSHQQRGSEVQKVSHRIDIGDETVKIFGIYSFHRFSAKIRKALSSWVKALGARQLCQMSFFDACKSYRLFRTNIPSNISPSVLLFFSHETFHFNLAI